MSVRDDEEPIVSGEDAPQISRLDNADLPGCGGSILCNPYRTPYRFIALAFMCFLSFGSYFCYDNPAALEDDIMNDVGLSTAQYGILYSVYSWPNVILAFFGGYLIDRVLGVRLGAIVFSFFIALGQIVFALGALVGHFWLMVVGRVIFSIGGENLGVAQNTYAVKWFKGKELNTVFGIQLSFARIGSTVNLYVMKPLHDAVVKTVPGSQGLGITLMIAAVSTVVSWLCAIVLAILDRRNDKYLSLKRAEAGEDLQPKEPFNRHAVRILDVLQFPLTFWLLCIICVAFYVAIFPFVGFGLVFFESKYKLSPYEADICNSLIYFISILACPVCGRLVDFFGRNCFFIILAILGTIGGHCLFAFSFLPPYLPMVVIGISYATLAASLWPGVAYVVPSNALATAYGVMQSVQNLGLALLFISAGQVVDARGYLMLELYFIAWLCIALGAAILLYFADSVKSGVLNMPNLTRKEFLDAQENTKKDA